MKVIFYYCNLFIYLASFRLQFGIANDNEEIVHNIEIAHIIYKLTNTKQIQQKNKATNNKSISI